MAQVGVALIFIGFFAHLYLTWTVIGENKRLKSELDAAREQLRHYGQWRLVHSMKQRLQRHSTAQDAVNDYMMWHPGAKLEQVEAAMREAQR